ncbi:MAG: hypothetical protein HY986_21820, partial [Candidatus Melainabacteria bacterium]|nr:hypothetical protein [Candidatus Melainabacteria bacterium]
SLEFATVGESAASGRKISSRSPFAAGLSMWGGSFLMLLPGGLIVTYIGEIIAGTTRHGVPSQVGLIAFLTGLVYLGFRLVSGQLKERRAVKELYEEQALLNRAKSKHGVLTVSEAALDCRLSILDAKQAFERLSKLSVCQIDVTEQGELCYRFPSFENPCEPVETLMPGFTLEVKEKDPA